MQLKQNIRKLLHRENFNPTVLGLFINPFYITRKALYRKVKSYSHHIEGNVLDVGCGCKPYQKLFNYEKYIGIDITNESHDHAGEDVDVYYDGTAIPFGNDFFDSAVCFEVLEHVKEPDALIKEIFRVTKPGGKILLTTPFIWDIHESPNDYWRYTPFALKHLFESNGFIVVNYDKTCADFSVIPQFIIMFLSKYMTKIDSIL